MDKGSRETHVHAVKISRLQVLVGIKPQKYPKPLSFAVFLPFWCAFFLFAHFHGMRLSHNPWKYIGKKSIQGAVMIQRYGPPARSIGKRGDMSYLSQLIRVDHGQTITMSPLLFESPELQILINNVLPSSYIMYVDFVNPLLV